MQHFYEWLKQRNPSLLIELITAGPSYDWSDPDKAHSDMNTPQYMARGVRSKYIATMKAETKKKNKRTKRK